MDVKVAKQVFLDIKCVLNKERIKFWLVDGIALGAVRNKGIIPYDLDIDLRVMARDWDFPKMIKAFEAAGFKCKKSINPPLYRDKPSGIILNKRGIKTDMCLGYHYPPDDLIVVLAGRPAKDISVLPARLFKGNHFIRFLGTTARIPYPASEYLGLVFGPNWKTPSPAKCIHPQISIQKYVDYFHKFPKVNQKG